MQFPHPSTPQTPCYQQIRGIATTLDCIADSQLPIALEEANEADFLADFADNKNMRRNPLCKIAYQSSTKTDPFKLYINGECWAIENVCQDLLLLVSNRRVMACDQLVGFLNKSENKKFIFGLWQLQWLSFDNDLLT